MDQKVQVLIVLAVNRLYFNIVMVYSVMPDTLAVPPVSFYPELHTVVTIVPIVEVIVMVRDDLDNVAI